MAPRQLCNNLLHEASVWVGLGKGVHVFQVPSGEPARVGEVAPKVLSGSIYNSCHPAFRDSPIQNVPANASVKKNQLPVDAGDRT
jgi:hypothetical protein